MIKISLILFRFRMHKMIFVKHIIDQRSYFCGSSSVFLVHLINNNPFLLISSESSLPAVTKSLLSPHQTQTMLFVRCFFFIITSSFSVNFRNKILVFTDDRSITYILKTKTKTVEMSFTTGKEYETDESNCK